MSATDDGLTGRCPACGKQLDGAGFLPTHMRNGDCPAVSDGGGDDGE